MLYVLSACLKLYLIIARFASYILYILLTSLLFKMFINIVDIAFT